MLRIISCSLFFILCSVWCAAVRAQSTSTAQVSKVFAVLSTSVDTKTAARGDQILFTTMNDLAVNGRVVIPKGSKVVGHVGSVVNRGNDAAKSALAIVIDKAVVNEKDVPLEAIVAAIAAPQSSDSSKQRAAGTQAENAHDQVFLLKEDSTGAIGYQGVSVAWNLTVPPPSTIFATNAKSLKLLSGTQMLLRMIPPQTPN